MISASTMDDLSEAARDGMASLNLKKTGSASLDRKHKSLRERWFTREPKQTGADAMSIHMKSTLSAAHM